MKTLVLAAIVAVSFLSASGQQRMLNQSEFDAIVRDDKEQTRMWAGKSYRMTVSTSTSASDLPASNFSSKTIFEFGSDHSSRSYNSFTFNGKTETKETLKIGTAAYVRSGTGPWQLTQPQNTKIENEAPVSTSDPWKNTGSEKEYKSLGAEDWNGVKVNVYLRTERLQETNASTGETRSKSSTSKFWVSQEGLIFKSEYHFETTWGHRISRTSIEIQRELDPNIKFVTPKFTPEQ